MNVLANFGIRPRDIDIVRHLIGRGPGTPDSRSLIDELFAFQSLLVPGFDRRHPADATFSRDWLRYWRHMATTTAPGRLGPSRPA